MVRELILAVAQVVGQDPLREALRLDEQGKCQEAERYYQQALAASPSSPAVLNNAGNHYVLCGPPEKAQTYFERLVAINPAHPNANLQLARLATEKRQGAKALEYLARVKDPSPAVALLRAEATHWAGQRGTALSLLDGLKKAAGGDERVQFTMGLACARMGLYERAAAAFEQVLVKRPGDVNVLFNLGRVHAARRDYSRAVYVLAQARQQAPGRPDVLLALAQAAENAGYYGDSALAYDEYVRLRPADDAVRRDRARVYCLTGSRMAEGLRELAAHLKKHPGDAAAYFALAQFSWETEPEKALEQLSSAIRLNPNFAAARFGRAWLLNRLGRTAEALPDYQAAARLAGRNAHALDQLGLAYLTLDRPAEAEKTLRQALAVAPQDAQVLMHLGRALMALGREAEAQKYLEAFRKVKPATPRDPRKEPGMIELATMSQSERVRSQIDRLRKDARDHPNDAELQLALASLLLADGKNQEAITEFRELQTRNADERIWEEAGRSLLRAGQYALAKEFLERAFGAAARLDLAVALGLMGETAGAEKTLAEIELRWPEWDRPHLVHGLVLEGAGKKDAARQRLRAAQALGSRDPAVNCALARLAGAAAPDPRCACLAELQQLVRPGCDKP